MNKFNLKVALSAALIVLPASGYSARPDFAQQPLFLGSAVAPNLMFIIDVVDIIIHSSGYLMKVVLVTQL